MLAADDAAFAGSAQQRAELRSNMFVAAVLCCGQNSVPARIRNMSRGGALIEAAAIPAEGSPVRLTRGSLSADGKVAWRHGNRAGIRFEAEIAASDWLPGNRPSGQQRVDAIIHACRTGTAAGHDDLLAGSSVADETRGKLLEYSEALHIAAAELAADLAVAAGHPGALQAIDVTAHKLEELAARLTGQDQIPPSTASYPAAASAPSSSPATLRANRSSSERTTKLAPTRPCLKKG